MNLARIPIFIFSCLLFLCQNSTAQEVNYRQQMRNLVIEISENAKAKNENFLVIPQNGIELILSESKNPALNYLKAIDAVGQEDLFYGYPEFNQPTPKPDITYLLKHLEIAKNQGKEVLVTDYCSTSQKVANSFCLNKKNEFISFAATRRELDEIPDYAIFNENKADINHISEAKNFLYLLNYANYPGKKDLIAEIAFTNYDLIIIDLFFNKEAFTAEEIKKLKKKKNGGDRLVIAYMSIGEAEEYRYYWKDSWNKNPPTWLAEENPYWSGNFKVKYWHPEWKGHIYRNKDAYLKKIVNLGFDGVYLDIIDAYQYFEASK